MIIHRLKRNLFPVAAALLLTGVSAWSVAGEVAVDPADNGTDIRDDTTEDKDSRSSEVTAAVEEFVEAVPGHSHDVPLAEAVTAAEGRAEPLELLGAEIPPGESMRLSWSATELFEGVPVSTPVLAINGALPGPSLCLTAAVHGDELNGVEMVRRVMHDVNPDKLSGAIIGVPIVNVQGFRRGSRYLPDRRDLNRYFRATRPAALQHASHTLFSPTSSRIATHSSICTRARSNAPTCRKSAQTCAIPTSSR